jgi:hypothetical protein
MAVLAAACALAVPAAALANDHRSESQAQHGKTVTTVTTAVPSPGSSQSAQGVVQSVSSTAIVVRQLDGSTVTVPVDRRTTQLFVDNRRAQWSDLKPGYVLSASWKAGKPAPTLRFSRP